MQDLTPHARFESDYEIELAESMNGELEGSQYRLAYVVYDGVYLVELEDEEGDWRLEGEFTEEDNAYFEATDQLAKTFKGFKLIDFPGTDHPRMLYTEED